MIEQLRRDERGVMSPVAHSMTIAITSLLIIGLLLSATALLDNQQETATRDELRTVGNRIAANIAHVDALAQGGGIANVTTQQVARIAGSTYTVTLEGGSECDTPRTTTNTDTCLRLASTDTDVVQYVPVDNESRIHLQSGTGGVFHISADRQAAATEFSTRDRLDLSTRVGIGSEVSPSGVTLGNQIGNRPPIAKFTFDPGSPQDGEVVTFDASESRDPDGNIVSYEWDWDGDGVYEQSTGGPTILHSFASGTYNVSLRVEDSEGSTSNFTRFIDVSGLVYNDDLDIDGGDNRDVVFSVTNNFGEEIEITHLMIDPLNDNIDEIDNGGGWEINLSTSSESNDYDDDIELHDGGRIVHLDDGGNFASTDLDPGDTATIRIHGFSELMNGERIDLGVQYIYDTTPNSSSFTGVPDGVGIANYDLDATGSNVDLSFEATHELDSANVEYGGAANGTLSLSDFSREPSSVGYRYSTRISSGVQGAFWANLTNAVSNGQTAVGVPVNDSTVTTSGTFIWMSASDWDNATSAQGIVHDSFSNHSADRLELGYPRFDRGGSNLVGYWTLDNDTDAADASGTGNDGMITGTPDSAVGLFGANSYNLNGSGEYVRIPDSSSIDVSGEDEVTISAWVRQPTTGDAAIFQHGDSYNFFLENDRVHFRVERDAGFFGDAPLEATSSTTLADGTWHHVVGVYDRQTASVYVNSGTPDTDSGFADWPNIYSGGTDAGLGEDIENPGQAFEGQIDEVRLYDRDLSATEVQQLYEAPSEGTLTTDWVVGSAINGTDAELQYNVSVGGGETVEVRVHSREDGSVETSDWMTPSDGAGSLDVTGLDQQAAEYRVEVRLSTNAVTLDPTVDSLQVVEGS